MDSINRPFLLTPITHSFLLRRKLQSLCNYYDTQNPYRQNPSRQATKLPLSSLSLSLSLSRRVSLSLAVLTFPVNNSFGVKTREKNMVGIFSRFSVSKAGPRRTRSALDEREVLPSNPEITGAATVTATSSAPHGIEVAVEFKPVEHPTEPLDNDQPVQCPLPEPSILNDGRIWKDRVSSVRRRADLPVMNEGAPLESETGGTKPRLTHSNRSILPSVSAPEHNILNLLEE